MSKKRKVINIILTYILIFLILLVCLLLVYINAKNNKKGTDVPFFRMLSFGELISIVLSCIAIVVACMIPNRIMWRQFFSDLNAKYMDNDFAEAIEGIIDFFVDDCKKDVANIATKYRELFDKNKRKWRKLHNYRRLLSQFYYNLDLCVKGRFGVPKCTLKSLYGEPEADIVKILFYMNKAVYNDKEMYKDIHVEEKLSKYKDMQTMNKHMLNIWKALKR